MNVTLPIPSFFGTPATDAALPPAQTGEIATENPFYSALLGQLPVGAGMAPEAGQAAMPAAEQEEKDGQDLSVDGKDLPPPPLSLLTTSTNLLNPATDTPAAVIASTAQTLVDPAILANGGVLVVPVVSSPAQTASGPASVSVVASDAEERVLASQTSQPGTRKASIQVSSGPAAVKNDIPTDAADTVSPDPLAAITDKIVLAREATADLARTATTAAQPTIREGTSDNQPFMRALADMMPASHGASARSAMHATPINVPFNQPGWDQSLGERVHWLVTQRFQAVELHLNPPELGPVEIRLSLNKDQASIQFLSPHASVRDAIETAMPRLREMLGDSGIQLADVNVGQHSGERQALLHPDYGASHHASRTFIPEVHGEDEAAVMAATTAISALGIVDYYV